MAKVALRILFVFFFGLSSAQAQSGDLGVFLRSCAYGTAAGAILGLGVVALSENPGEKLNTVARGASLGLYAGMGFGLYALYGEPRSSREYSMLESSQLVRNPIWFSFVQSESSRVDGLQLNWANISF